MKKRPKIVSIAGFDPTGGAGLLADIKTFEANKCQGFAVQTANTVQTEDKFESVNWVQDELMLKQLDFLLEQYSFGFAKIGLISSLDLLKTVVDRLLTKNENTIIIWDPILAVSAGFDFEHDLTNLEDVLSKIHLFTPNWVEMERIGKDNDCLAAAKRWSEYCKVYLKGGHNKAALGKDYLFDKGNVKTFNPKQGDLNPKHGSGCVFSSALLANLAKGHTEQKAVLKAKRYIEWFLGSDKSLLGYHYA